MSKDTERRGAILILSFCYALSIPHEASLVTVCHGIAALLVALAIK